MTTAEMVRSTADSVKRKTKDYSKEYDVFFSRVCFSYDQSYWWEEFKFLGKLKAYNSVSALKAAKEKYPEYCRLAVVATAHPLSHSNLQLRSAMQTSRVLNRLTNGLLNIEPKHRKGN